MSKDDGESNATILDDGKKYGGIVNDRLASDNAMAAETKIASLMGGDTNQ